MPFTDSGLWIPYGQPPRPSWKLGLTLPVIVSVLSVLIATGGLWVTRYNTQVAQRAYVSYSFHVQNRAEVLQRLKQGEGNTLVEYRITIRNLGNTPALNLWHELSVNPAPNMKIAFDQHYQPPWVDIPPKDSFDVDGTVVLSESSNNTFSMRGAAIWFSLWGNFSYGDVFGIKHSLEVCSTVYVQGDTLDEGTCYSTETRRVAPRTRRN